MLRRVGGVCGCLGEGVVEACGWCGGVCGCLGEGGVEACGC